DMVAGRRDVEAAQVSFVGELCDLPSIAGDEIDQPEIQRLWDWPVHEMPLVEETIAPRADPQPSSFFLNGREIVLLAVSSDGLQRCTRSSPGYCASGKQTRIHDEVAVR